MKLTMPLIQKRKTLFSGQHRQEWARKWGYGRTSHVPTHRYEDMYQRCYTVKNVEVKKGSSPLSIDSAYLSKNLKKKKGITNQWVTRILLSFVISPNSGAFPELLWLRLVILPVLLATFTASLFPQFQLKREVLGFVLKNSTTRISHTFPFPKLLFYFNF